MYEKKGGCFLIFLHFTGNKSQPCTPLEELHIKVFDSFTDGLVTFFLFSFLRAAGSHLGPVIKMMGDLFFFFIIIKVGPLSITTVIRNGDVT